MKARIFGLVCCFISAILQFISFVMHHDTLNLFVAIGFATIGALYIYKICKEEAKKDDTVE